MADPDDKPISISSDSETSNPEEFRNDKLSSLEKAPSFSDSKDVCVFVDDAGRPLSFILSNMGFNEEKECKKLILDRCGIVKKLREFSDYDAVLVPDSCVFNKHTGDVFKVSYIKDCVKTGKLLNISEYKCGPDSKLISSFNYMDIIYRRRYTWNSVPERFLKPKEVLKPGHQRSNEDRLLDDDNDDDDVVVDDDYEEDDDDDADNNNDSNDSVSSQSGKPLKVDKRTNTLFTSKEKRAMVDYIFQKKEFDQLKGNVFWKKMEASNVCPVRTWQSMKNHFQKTLSHQLNAYRLPQEDYAKFRKWYFHKSNQHSVKNKF